MIWLELRPPSLERATSKHCHYICKQTLEHIDLLFRWFLGEGAYVCRRANARFWEGEAICVSLKHGPLALVGEDC